MDRNSQTGLEERLSMQQPHVGGQCIRICKLLQKQESILLTPLEQTKSGDFRGIDLSFTLSRLPILCFRTNLTHRSTRALRAVQLNRFIFSEHKCYIRCLQWSF
jgi:hypothetical protein